MTAFVRSGRPGWRLRTANPLIAGGPDPNAVIQIRDRLAAHAEGPAPTTRWCVCLNLHYWTWTLVPTIYCFFYVVAAVAVNCIIISMEIQYYNNNTFYCNRCHPWPHGGQALDLDHWPKLKSRCLPVPAAATTSVTGQAMMGRLQSAAISSVTTTSLGLRRGHDGQSLPR
jgi:hypothetical protein